VFHRAACQTRCSKALSAAPFVSYAMIPPDACGPDNPMMQFFSDHFSLGEGREKTREWAMRVMAYDR